MARVTRGCLSRYPYPYLGTIPRNPTGLPVQFSAKTVKNWLRYVQNNLKGIFGMFCSYLSQFSTVLAKNWTVGKVAGIRTLTRIRTRRYPYPKPAGVAKPLQFPNARQGNVSGSGASGKVRSSDVIIFHL